VSTGESESCAHAAEWTGAMTVEQAVSVEQISIAFSVVRVEERHTQHHQANTLAR
jgi:hypothetical protein